MMEGKGNLFREGMMHLMQIAQIIKNNTRVGIPIFIGVVFFVTMQLTTGGNDTVQALQSQNSESINISNDDVIYIGVAVALNGPADSMGWRQLNSIELAVDEVNSAGGIEIGGKKYDITIINADSKCDATQAESAANALVLAGVKAVIGHTCSGASFQAQSIYADSDLAMISPSSTAPNITDQGFDTTFRVIPRDDTITTLIATQLRNRYKFTKVAVIEVENKYHNWATQSFKDTFINLGGTITSHKLISSMEDLDDVLEEIKPKNPEVIYFPNDNASDAGTLSKKVSDLGMKDTVIAWAPLWVSRTLLDDYVVTSQSTTEGDIAALSYQDTEDMPGYSKFKSDYIAAGNVFYGDEPQLWGAFAYDAAKIVIAALERANSLDTTKIRDEIAKTTNYQGVVGTYIGFDDKGDVIPQGGMIFHYKDGYWETIWPYLVYIPVVMEN
jgi:branched-chain amino acid transport system substrate-binding protein